MTPDLPWPWWNFFMGPEAPLSFWHLERSPLRSDSWREPQDKPASKDQIGYGVLLVAANLILALLIFSFLSFLSDLSSLVCHSANQLQCRQLRERSPKTLSHDSTSCWSFVYFNVSGGKKGAMSFLKDHTIVLFHSGCYNKIPQTGRLISNRNLLFWRLRVQDQGARIVGEDCLPGQRLLVVTSQDRRG